MKALNTYTIHTFAKFEPVDIAKTGFLGDRSAILSPHASFHTPSTHQPLTYCHSPLLPFIHLLLPSNPSPSTLQVYLVPLRELAHSSSAILSVQEVESLFGPIEKILKFQEMFYTAIIARTLDWTAETKIGDVLSSVSSTTAGIIISRVLMYMTFK